MVKAQSTHPRWFVLWRRLIYFAIALFILTILYIVPLSLASLGTGQVSVSDVDNWVGLIATTSFFAASALSVIALTALLVTNAVLSRRHAPSAMPWRHVTRPILGATIAFISTVVIGFLLPPLNNHFLPIVTGLSMCEYQFRVVAFEDQNGNGIRDPNDPGLSNVSMTVSYPDPQPGETSPTNISRSAISDDSGLAVVYVTYSACPSNATEYGSATITAQTPSGYKATTPTTFGPLSLKFAWSHVGTVQTVYVGFTKES